jgi:hypothetical protein
MSTVRITSRKFYNNFKNDNTFSSNTTDYTPNLTAVLLDYCRIEMELELSWESVATSINSWNVIFRSSGNYEISTNNGNFIQDGWAVNNVFHFFDDASSSTPTLIGTGTINFISDDGKYIFVSIPSSIAGIKTDSSIRAIANNVNNYNNSVVYTPNLIENNDTYTPNSLLNGTVTAFYSTNARSLTPVMMSYMGSNRSSYGEVSIQYLGEIGDYIQSYKIIHDFYVVPFNGDLNFLSGTNTLKHVFEIDFRDALSNPNTSKKAIFDGNLGSVGSYNETISQGIPNYTFESLFYNRQALAIEQQTTATIKIKGTFSGDTKYTVYFALNPLIVNENPFFDTFLLNYASNFVGLPLSNFSDNVITSLTSFVSADELTILATFNFTPQLQALLSENDAYLITVRIGDVSSTNANSDRVIFLADSSNFISVTENNGLININNIILTDYHGLTGISVPFYNEDGFFIDFDMSLDLNKQAFLSELSCDLVAINAENFFSLSRYVYDLQFTVVDGVQIINIDRTRGYLQSTDSDYNKVIINTADNIAGIQSYNGKLGFKINWLEWVENPSVDTIFYDDTKPFNNFNFKTSNYSNLNDYQIKLLFRATVRGLNPFGVITNQKYQFFSESFRVYDYDKDDSVPPNIVATVETFSSDGSQNLNGNILTDSDTLFRITWVLSTPVSDVIGSTCVHRIELENQQGTNIFELSSFNPLITTTNNILKPLIGENFVKVYLSAGTIVSECLIDYTKIQRGLNYYLSGKITRI